MLLIKILNISLLLSFVLLLQSCDSDPQKIENLEGWGYQLQNYNGEYSLERIIASDKKLWVIDAFSEEGLFSIEKISMLKKDKVIISYFSIGEAENYRPYFKSINKKLLLPENPNWPGNFPVKYWDPAWRDVIDDYLDKIIKAGFDGVYLDIVDAFDYYEDKKVKAKLMFDLIKHIRKYAQERTKNFYIFQQNATSLISYLDKPSDLKGVVDALGVESAFFRGDKLMNNPYRPDKYMLDYIRQYQSIGIPVFSIEYINQKNLIQKYCKISAKERMIPLAAEKNLDGKLYFCDE